jgi:hypothetical protein
MLHNYGSLESFEFYIWPGVAYRGAKVVFESLKSSVTAKIKMSGMKLLGAIIHVSSTVDLTWKHSLSLSFQVSFGNMGSGNVLYLEEVPYGFSKDDITSKFRVCGRVKKVVLAAKKGLGLVYYDDEETAARALSYMRMNSKQAAGIKVQSYKCQVTFVNVFVTG